MRRRFLVLLAAAACNRAFGIENTGILAPDDAAIAPDGDPRIDLDLDDIKDIEDPCIAPYTDLLVDTDGDSALNGTDLCVLDPGATADTDGDGIGDRCDPTPDNGDRTRCVMAFTDPELDVAMWHPRDEAAAWIVYGPRALSGRGKGSISADWSFESANVTTFQISGYVYTGTMAGTNRTTRFDVLARAGRVPDSTDVGCSIVAGATWSLVGSDGSSASLGTPPTSTIKASYAMSVTIVPRAPDGRTLRCTARLDNGPTATLDQAATLPFGTLGFATDGLGGVSGIVVYERDDAPP